MNIHALRSCPATPSRVLEAECGKGTYVRAIARDLGRALGCLGHVVALRRTRVGPFFEADSTDPRASSWMRRNRRSRQCWASRQDCPNCPASFSTATGAARLRRGQSVILRGRDAPSEGAAYAVVRA